MFIFFKANRRPKTWFLGALACCCLYLIINTAHAEEAAPLPADVRLVIDVSGSMKRNDPNNLRKPAIDLLVQLLPDGSKAGVWTFGKWVNMLVPHRVVDDKWRASAEELSNKINSVGLYTNIGEALEKAAYNKDEANKAYKTSLILLTDGMVDIAKDPEANKKEWRRIVDEVMPELKDADYTIHTIALSDNADKNLMSKLSLATDGVAEVAHTAEDLMRIFLKTFDVAAPAEQVPLSDNQFVIDSSVEEFTALIFRENPSEQTEIVGPDKKNYSARKKDKDLKWHRAANYDLITVKQPLEGEWGVKAKMAPDSRITVVSNLNLRVRPLPNNVFKGNEETLEMSLQEDGKTIVRSEFLSLMDIEASMEAGNDEFALKEFWRESIANPQAGIYSQVLPTFSKDGIYQLSVIVDGKTFVRQFNHQFTVRQPFGAEVKQFINDGVLEYRIIANAYSTQIDIEQTQVVATVEAPGRRKKIRPLEPTDEDTWQATLLPEKEGEYKAVIKAKGMNAEGEAFEITLESISFVYSLDGGFVESKEPFFEEPTPQPTAEPAPEAETPAEENQTVEEEQEDTTQAPIPPWMLYSALGLGNLLLFVGGFFLIKKLIGRSNDDEVLEQFSDEKIAEEKTEAPDEPQAEEDPDEAAQEEDEEEPPMEDLDTSIVEEEIAQDTETGDEDLDPEIQSEDLPADDFDDLDQMAMEESEEASEEASPETEEYPVEPEDDDMVAEMLKAQGLDLAEEELDDAISSLIDDLEQDEEEDEDKA